MRDLARHSKVKQKHCRLRRKFSRFFPYLRASTVAQMVKHPLQRGRPGLSLWVRKVRGERNDYPLQYSCLENCMGRRAWRATVHGVAKSQT